jgi:hypothetical protein
MKIHVPPREPTPEHECDQAETITAIQRELGDLNKAVFRGNGKPSLIAQMAVVDSKISALCWLVGGTCMAVVGQIVIGIFKAIGKG